MSVAIRLGKSSIEARPKLGVGGTLPRASDLEAGRNSRIPNNPASPAFKWSSNSPTPPGPKLRPRESSIERLPVHVCSDGRRADAGMSDRRRGALILESQWEMIKDANR